MTSRGGVVLATWGLMVLLLFPGPISADVWKDPLLEMETLVTVSTTMAVADVTGVVMAAVMAGLGLFVILPKRRQ